jgi:phosphoglycolate phosphatase
VAGVAALLERLRSRGCRLGIATADTRESTEAGLRAIGILGCFDFISADGDGYPAKPDPAAALAFSARFGIAPGNLVVVGDSRGDMRFAQEAGARFIGMRTACNESERFAAAGYPVIENFMDAAEFERLIA